MEGEGDASAVAWHQHTQLHTDKASDWISEGECTGEENDMWLRDGRLEQVVGWSVRWTGSEEMEKETDD